MRITNQTEYLRALRSIANHRRIIHNMDLEVERGGLTSPWRAIYVNDLTEIQRITDKYDYDSLDPINNI